MCDDPDLASTTLTLPSPYALSDAEQWIPKHAADFEKGVAMTLAITLRDTGVIVGDVGLQLSAQHARGELGYLMGKLLGPRLLHGGRARGGSICLRRAQTESRLRRAFHPQPGLGARDAEDRNAP
jgi:hypothetical protein